MLAACKLHGTIICFVLSYIDGILFWYDDDFQYYGVYSYVYGDGTLALCQSFQLCHMYTLLPIGVHTCVLRCMCIARRYT